MRQTQTNTLKQHMQSTRVKSCTVKRERKKKPTRFSGLKLFTSMKNKTYGSPADNSLCSCVSKPIRTHMVSRERIGSNCWNMFNALDLISAQWDICTASAERFYSSGTLWRSDRILLWNSCTWNCFREAFISERDFKWINRQKCFGLTSMWLRLQLE